MKLIPSSCARWERLLSTHWDEQTLSPAEKEELETHLIECAECACLYEDTQKMLSTLRARVNVAPLPRNLAQQIRLEAPFRKGFLSRMSSARSALAISIEQCRKQGRRSSVVPPFIAPCFGLCLLLFGLLLSQVLSGYIDAAMQASAMTLAILVISMSVGIACSLCALVIVIQRMRNASSSFFKKREKCNAPSNEGNESGTLISISQARKQIPTTFQNKALHCRECGNAFTFTAGEQEFYQQKGLLNQPTRCPDCRVRRRTAKTIIEPLLQKEEKTKIIHPDLSSSERCGKG